MENRAHARVGRNPYSTTWFFVPLENWKLASLVKIPGTCQVQNIKRNTIDHSEYRFQDHSEYRFQDHSEYRFQA